MTPAQIRKLVDEFADKEYGVGATKDEIANAETVLGVVLPETYRRFLGMFGWGRFSHQELYGVGSDTPPYLDLVKNASAERFEMEPRMPWHLVPVMNDGAGNHYCLDTARSVDGECPVVFWDHEQESSQTPAVMAPSFGQWFVDLLTELSGA
jgi:cell wall assembly regulator SMI1